MKTLKLFLIISFAGAMSACSKDGVSGNEDKKASVPTELRLSLNYNGTRGLNGEEEDGKPAENTINVVEFYIFDDAGNPDTEVGKSGSTPGNGYLVFTDSQLSKTIIVSSGNAKPIVALVNMSRGPLAAGDTYATLKAELNKPAKAFKATAGGTDHNSRAIPPTGLEMSGEVLANIAPAPAGNTVSIDILRLVSKVNAPSFNASTGGTPFGINLTENHIKTLWGTGTTITNDDITFNPLGWVVVNGLDRSGILFTGRDDGKDGTPKTLPWEDWSDTDKAHLNSAFDSDGLYTNNYSGYSASPDWFLSFGAATVPVYVYENKPLETTVSGQTGFDPLTVYAFVIKGELVVDGDTANNNGLNKTRYWRVNLVWDDNYHIMRNASYHVNITAINTPGHATPEDAETDPEIVPDANDTSMVIELDIKKWRINFYEEPM